jgi:hypothetical protein
MKTAEVGDFFPLSPHIAMISVAFLIPYVCSSLLIGFPVLYMEMCLGQFVQAGSTKAFYMILPIMQGILLIADSYPIPISVHVYNDN